MCGCNNLLHIGTFSCRPDSRGFFPDLGFHVNSCVMCLDLIYFSSSIFSLLLCLFVFYPATLPRDIKVLTPLIGCGRINE